MFDAVSGVQRKREASFQKIGLVEGARMYVWLISADARPSI